MCRAASGTRRRRDSQKTSSRSWSGRSSRSTPGTGSRSRRAWNPASTSHERERDREMDRLGVDTLDLDHRGSRYFVHAYGKRRPVERFLSSRLMVEIAQAALGETVYLFNEQYVVKAAERGMKFGWH